MLVMIHTRPGRPWLAAFSVGLLLGGALAMLFFAV